MLDTILLFLEARIGELVRETAIMKHVYDDPNKKTNRMKHLEKNMKKAKGYHLKKDRDEKGNVSYGLYIGGKNSD